MTEEQIVSPEGDDVTKSALADSGGKQKRRPIPPLLRKKQSRENVAPRQRQLAANRAAWIVPNSELAESQEIHDAPDDASYVRRVNALIAGGTRNSGARYPKDLAAAIKKKGELNRHAELIVFGDWLLVQKAPGLPRRGGKQFNPKLVLRTLATAMAEHRHRPAKASATGPETGKAKAALTATDLSNRWATLFDDAVMPLDFDARLGTLRRLLPAFLDHLRSGACQHAGKTIRSAPEIEAVYKAITLRARNAPTGQRSTVAAPSTSTSTTTAAQSVARLPQTPLPPTLAPFDIELSYSKAAQEGEYRGSPPGSLPISSLTYQPKKIAPSSAGRSVRKNRQGKIVLVPQLPIRTNFTVRALIDRLVILVSIRTRSTGRDLSTLLKDDAKVTGFAQDTTIPTKATDWRKQLKEPAWTKFTGYHFAIMVQDPTPVNLAKALKVIDDRFNIDGPVELFLLELSVDFYPKRHHAPDEQIRLRDQMVGLLQRHHWGSTGLLQGRRPQKPRDADARQVYGGGGRKPDRTETRFLFSDRSRQQFADIEFHEPEVTARLLHAKSGTAPFLNATVYKGCDETGRKVSIQHKVADERNPARGTKRPLRPEDRRARVELLLIGQDVLHEHQLQEVETLRTVSFRNLCKKLLLFRLPLVEPTQEHLDAAIAHMERRGIYGIELAARARAHREQVAARAARQTLPRKKVGEGADLQDWKEMNTLVGEALDKLGRAWHGFSWR